MRLQVSCFANRQGLFGEVRTAGRIAAVRRPLGPSPPRRTKSDRNVTGSASLNPAVSRARTVGMHGPQRARERAAGRFPAARLEK